MTDDQTKVVNRTFGNLLRCLTKEYGLTWDLVIHQAEFAYNDNINRTTGKSPFEILYGIHPRGVCKLRNLGNQVPNSCYAEDFSQSMKELHDEVKQALTENTKKLKDKVDLKRREVQFGVGELVMVDLNKARMEKGVPTKIQMRIIGP